jgi:hypothetical protein
LTGSKWNVSVASGVSSLQDELTEVQRNPASDDITIFGYSQGAAVASIEKSQLTDTLTTPQKSHFAFVLIGNPERPNGGIFERLALLGSVPILDATFGLPTSTTAGIQTTDIAFQYDGVADFPEYPINPSYLTPDGSADNPSSTELPDGYTKDELLAAEANPANRVQVGDTLYITIPARTLPILDPLIAVGQATPTSALVTPLVDLISPALRVLIDTGYDPNANPGVRTPFRLIPPINPVTLATDLARASVQGVQAAAADLRGARSPTPVTSVPLVPPILTVTKPSTVTPAAVASQKTATRTEALPARATGTAAHTTSRP